MTLIEELLKITYAREIELEDKIDRTISPNKWFFEQTKALNIELQIACLKEIDRVKSKHKYITGLH